MFLRGLVRRSLLIAVAMLAAACSGDDAAFSTTTASTGTAGQAGSGGGSATSTSGTSGGSAGTGGLGGSGGRGGAAGSSAAGGRGGAGGSAGAGGRAGSAGTAGLAGTGGLTLDAGGDGSGGTGLDATDVQNDAAAPSDVSTQDVPSDSGFTVDTGSSIDSRVDVETGSTSDEGPSSDTGPGSDIGSNDTGSPSDDTGSSSDSPDGGQAQCLAAGTLTVTNQGSTAYVINGQPNPALSLCRGLTYVFSVTAGPAHPFWIKSLQGAGTADAYNDGVTGNGTGAGNVTFAVPQAAPDTLYYNCENHTAMTNVIHIMN